MSDSSLPKADQLLMGRTAVVTGASSGIGAAIAERLARTGARVALIGRTEEPLREVQARIVAAGGESWPQVLDVRDTAALTRAIEKTHERTGGLHILVNNAGVVFPTSVVDGVVDHWQEMFQTNVLAVMAATRAAVQLMRAHRSAGHIVNIGSLAAQMDSVGVYAATKTALSSLTATIRRELRGDRIRVLEILPGAVITNLNRNFPAEEVTSALRSAGEDFAFRTGSRIPQDVLDRVQLAASTHFLHPDDVARAVTYAITQPAEVAISQIVIRPQAGR